MRKQTFIDNMTERGYELRNVRNGAHRRERDGRRDNADNRRTDRPTIQP